MRKKEIWRRLSAMILSLCFIAGNISINAVTINAEEDEQYHFDETDLMSVVKWKETYLPNGFEDLLQYDESWWDGLYDYERELADFLKSMIVELPENVYMEQDLSECIAILESGVSADAFFAGTIFEGLDLADLYTLQTYGYTLPELCDFWAASCGEDVESELFGTYLEQEEPGESLTAMAAVAGKIPIVNPILYTVEEGDEVAKMTVSYTGYSGTGHGKIYRLSVGGQHAFCLSMGKAARNGYLYHADEGTYERRKDGLGMLVSLANSFSGNSDYTCVQIAIWLYQKSPSYTKDELLIRAAAMLDITSEEAVESMTSTIWAYYRLGTTGSREYYVFHSDNGNAQDTATYSFPDTYTYTGGGSGEGGESGETGDEPSYETYEDSVEVEYGIQVHKTDWQTGVGLAGCTVDVFEDGDKITTLTTDTDGNLSHMVSKSGSFHAEYCSNYDSLSAEKKAAVSGHKSEEEAIADVERQIDDFRDTEYTYSIREVTAPNGYVWQANEQSKTISGDETASFHITNERTLGAVELVKYDTESESDIFQGDATLEGAVYGIYAAENIVHQDRRTGILYRKDQLVATAVIGTSPKRNADGYILNMDGTRHIANPGGVIAYEETPGRTLFGDLELGSYYIREITPSDGYMLDEASYEVTFTYKDQMVKIETRNETAGQADNELTADDGSTSHTVYSGDYVIKQGIQFIKTSDNTYQTELQPIEGAGFHVYLISELSGVRNGTIMPIHENWSADDIMTFYDYDFTGEPTATVYKRTGREAWTEGDTLWLTKVSGLNKYQVAEMFTDENGRIETPELPYGTYVFVETTTPEHHVAAKPFIAYVTQDGGVFYTDATKQTVEKTYTVEEGIRYGDHEATKDREGRVLQRQRFINNTITKAFLRVVKADEEFLIQPGTYIEAEEMVRGTVLKEGSSYRLRCLTMELSEESLKALNWKYDTDGYMSYYDPNAKSMTGTLQHPFEPAFLKKNGKILDCYITLPQEIPIGTYELEELTAPSGYVVNGSEQTVVDISSGCINGYEIEDTPWSRTVFTLNNGAVYPDGQMGMNKYALCDRYGNLTVTVLQENQEQKGIIQIYKHGEQLAYYDEESGFVYQDAPVEGASFQIIAEEDIYTQELQKEFLEQYTIDPEEYLVHRSGDVAAVITTDRNGWGYAANLYIGKYRIVEVTAGSGFVLNQEVKEFEITPQEQTVNFDVQDAVYQNERQKLEIQVTKTDKETGVPLAGAVYDLYAAEDIRTGIVYSHERGEWVIRDTPETIVPEGTVVASCRTGEDGKAVFQEDLPLAKYVIRERKAPVGYLEAVQGVEADGSYESPTGGQNVEVQKLSVSFQNQITETRISKRDLTNGRELEGAVLEVREVNMDLNGDPIKEGGTYVTTLKETWISRAAETEGHLIRGLKLDRWYVLRETKPADGYAIAEEILFRLEQDGEHTALYFLDGEMWTRPEDDLLIMYDDLQQVDVEKSADARAKRGELCHYTIEEIRNTTEDELENFTVTDHLPRQVRITELWTGTYSQELEFNVEYQLNGREDWNIWAEHVSSRLNTYLTAPETEDGMYITKFRFCFGTVEGLFTRMEKPSYTVRVLEEAAGDLVNEIILTAEQNGIPVSDRDQTTTKLEEPNIPGKEKKSHHSDEDAPAAEEMKVSAPLTGDQAHWLLWAGAAFLAAGILLWILRRRKN